MTADRNRANVVSSFTVVKGSLVPETYRAFQAWDWRQTKRENLARMREDNTFGSGSASWSLNVSKVINRRFDPGGRDRPLVELTKTGCELRVWRPILLWHMTRDEFLVRDFLVNWLYQRYVEGVFRLRADDVAPYLHDLRKNRSIELADEWTDRTTERVASGLLRMALDFELVSGGTVKEFVSYHLPDESFLYLLHALAELNPSAQGIIGSDEWRMYLLDASDVERELLRLHQFGKLRFESAGTLQSLSLPCSTAAEYAKELAT